MEREHYIKTNECPACHYKYSYDWDDRKELEGNQEFVSIDVIATYESEGNYGGAITTKLNVIMCPECGVLIGKRF